MKGTAMKIRLCLKHRNYKNKWILFSLIFRKDMQKKDKKPCVNYAKIGRRMRLSSSSVISRTVTGTS